MDYSKIQEPCFVCDVEDGLGEERGSMSHPINCGWRVNRTKEAYEQGLSDIISLCIHPVDKDVETLAKEIRDKALSVLMGRYDVK